MIQNPHSTTTADLARRLQAILQEVAYEVKNPEEFNAIISNACGDAFFEGDAQHRHDGHLVRVLLAMAGSAAAAGIEEMDGQEGFYLDEADSIARTGEGSTYHDNTPAECRKYAREYAKAAMAYRRTQAGLNGMGKRLAKRLTASGI